MGLWADTFGGGNSFTESVANTFTPGDGAKYVGGDLVHDGGNEDGQALTAGTYSHTGDKISGNFNNSLTDAAATANTVTGSAPTGVAKALGFASPIGIVGKISGWANGLDPAKDIIGGEVVAGKQVYKKEDGFQYSYNFLGLPYQVEVADGEVKDFLLKDDGGKFPGDEGYNQSTSGYQIMAQTARASGNDEDADAILQESASNATVQTGGGAGNPVASAGIIQEYATQAGVIQNQQDMEAIVADPYQFLVDRGLTLADITPSMDPNAAGTALDPTKLGYGLGTNEGYGSAGTGPASIVADVSQPGTETYSAKMTELTDNELVNAATGTVSDNATVNAEDFTIDMQGAATGVNADGTRSVLGEALNDFASQNISKVIDTSTVAGKLLAQKLGEGNYTDSKATVLGQMKIISSEFKNSQGEPIIPVWAQAMHRDASKSIAFSGISGTAATAAFSNAIMEATLGVAEQDASFFQTLTNKNLDNRQQSVINKANVLSNLSMANLDARSQAAVTNAKSFMQMDMANLTNQQQAEVVNKQAFVQAMFDNTSATNAERLFTVQTENDMNKFYSELQNSVARHNSAEKNALSKFNSGESNDAAQFNADIKNDRQQFLSSMQYNIDISNAKWRQTVETLNNQNIIDAHTSDVKASLDLTQEAQNALWDSADNLLDYIWKTSDSDQDRELRLLTSQMTVQSGQTSGGGFMEGLLGLGGAFLGTSTGASWLSALLPSDVRLKDNIQFYDTLHNIKFYTWDWNEEGKRIGATQYPSFGVLAQEIQKTHPAAVSKDADGYLRVNYRMIKNDI